MALAARLRLGWLSLLLHKELRVVSQLQGRPYACTVMTLSGRVIVQLDRQFWRGTPPFARDAALRRHRRDVQAAVKGLGSPAGLIAAASGGLRLGLLLAGAGGGASALHAASAAAAGWLLPVALAFLPRRLLAAALQPLFRVLLRRLFRTA